MDFCTLHKHYTDFFDYYEGKNDAGEFYAKGEHYDHVFYMALDTEWHKVGNRNNILSYQIATASRFKTHNKIEYTDAGQRLTLIELVELGLKSVIPNKSLEELDRKKIGVFLVAHNFVAEWSSLADRDESYIIKRLDLIRKSPITKGRQKIDLVINQSIDVRIAFYDTMLLAPASHRSLKKLSALLGEEPDRKEDIKQRYIEHMDQYLQDDPDGFERYALKDTAVTLQLFFLLQKEFNTMVYKKIDIKTGKFKLFRTLASAAVKGFLYKDGIPSTGEKTWYEEYLRELGKEEFKKPYQLVKRCYLGGRNESFFIGRTRNYPETRDKIWIDVDFKGCYPTAMALCPKIDTAEKPVVLPLEYKIDGKTAKELRDLNVPHEIISKLRNALKLPKKAVSEPKSEELAQKAKKEFEKILFELKGKNKDLSWDIRTATRVINNKLIDKWYIEWNMLKKRGGSRVEHFLIPGFARVFFKFPEGTQFPCLPIRHEKYGQIYTLKGETHATAIELMLAKDAGAEVQAITSVEFPVAMDIDNIGSLCDLEKNILFECFDLEYPLRYIFQVPKPEKFTLNHLSNLARERDKNKKIMKSENPDVSKEDKLSAEIRERLIKEFSNSFYGKFAQAVNMKKVYRPSTGEQHFLGPSELSEPITASLVTSLARAALSATLLAVSDFNRDKSEENHITVVSATTDGLLIGVPAPKGYSILGKYYEMDGKWAKFKKEYETQLPQVLNNFGCGDLIEKINTYFPVKRMQYSREKMTDNPDVFEIKHMADEIISIKTRGQIGLLSNGQATLLARFNLKPPLSEIVEDKEVYKRMMEESGIERNTEEARWILKHWSKIENNEDKIEHYSFITLNTFQDIFKSDGEKDLVRKVRQRQMNMDWDWKRKIVWADESDKKAISPFTEPFENLSQMLKHRKMMESLRYKNVEGERVPWTVARPERVLQKIAVPRGSVHSRGGDPVVITRQFLRGMMQDKIYLNRKKDSYKVMANQLNDIWKEKGLNKSFPRVWKEHDFQNAKNPDQAKWQPGLIQSNMLLEEVVESLANNYGADVQTTKDILFDFEKFKSDQILLIGEVISVVIDGPKNHVEPFKTLFDSYLLPSKEKIRDTFREKLSDRQLESFMKKSFVPGGRPSYDLPELKKIFYSLGIPSGKAEKCARSIAPSSRKKGSFRNPGQKRCSEHFLLAVINIVEADSGNHIKYLQQKLQKFEISRNRYYQIRKRGRFTPNGIANTPKNITQIMKMAKSIDMEASLFKEVLLEK